MTAYEDFVTEEVRGGRSIVGLYPATDEQALTDFAAWRRRKGRWRRSPGLWSLDQAQASSSSGQSRYFE
jgi:hypothetical protein